MKKRIRVWIWSDDETPRCGSGCRLVDAEITPRGPRGGGGVVRLYPLYGAVDNNPDRVSLETYEALVERGSIYS